MSNPGHRFSGRPGFFWPGAAGPPHKKPRSPFLTSSRRRLPPAAARPELQPAAALYGRLEGCQFFGGRLACIAAKVSGETDSAAKGDPF
jgi:hypothetical protein